MRAHPHPTRRSSAPLPAGPGRVTLHRLGQGLFGALLLPALAQAADLTAPPRLADRPAQAVPAPAAAVAASAPALRHRVTRASPGNSDSGPTGDRREPRIERRVVEDDAARIEELRVRGAVQRMTVTPKGGGPIQQPYEIQPTDAGRDFGEGPSLSRTGGQRTWRVFSF